MENPLEGLPTFIKKSAIAKKMFKNVLTPNVTLSQKEKRHGRARFTDTDIKTLVAVTEGFKCDLETFLLKLKKLEK